LAQGGHVSEVKRIADAVWRGDLPAIEALIAAGADVNAAEADGHPPLLYLAIEQRWTEVARRLIAAGAEVNRYPGSGWGTPLAHAIDIESDAAQQRMGEIDPASTELTELLLAAGALPNQEAFRTADAYGNRRALALLKQYAHRVA
jgi:ankyrin repeat protein